MSFYNTSQDLEATDRMLADAAEKAAQGRMAEAEKLYYKALGNIVNLYGASSLKACDCLLELADIYYHTEQYAEVITLLEQVLVTNQSEQMFADDRLLAIKFKLGRSLEKSGNLRQAAQCYGEVLSGANVACGPNSPFTKTVAECARSLAKRTGGLVQAEGIDNRSAQSQTGNLGHPPSSPRTQYDTSQLERLKQSESMNMAEIAAKSDAASETHQDTSVSSGASIVSINRNHHHNLQKISKTRAYDCGIPTASKAKRRPLGALITIPAACVLVLWLWISGVLDDKTNRKDLLAGKSKDSGASATAALNPNSLAEYAGFYSSADGAKQFQVEDGGKGMLVFGQDSEPVKVSKMASELYAETEDMRVVFRPTGNCLIDEKGVKLFKRGSPELGAVAAARKMADDLNRYYAHYGKYPRSQMALQAAGVSYNNALTLRPTQPKLMCVSSETASSSMTLSDYQNANWMAANLMAMNGAMGEPGGIEVHVFPVSSVGETVFIRGFDRDGQLLPSSTAGKCFTLVLVAGALTK